MKFRKSSNIDSRLPNKLHGDEVRLRQILLNLLSNAVKYTRAGRVELRVSGERQAEGQVQLSFEITDTGIGIKKEEVEQLFDTFTRLDHQLTRSIEGTGLGLTITRSFLGMMGGDILVDSRYGEGSVFTARVPQYVLEPEMLAQVEKPDAKKVLLLETRPNNAASLLEELTNLNVACTVARSLDEFAEYAGEGFSHAFVQSTLFDRAAALLAQKGLNAQLVLMAEHGELSSQPNVSTLTLPAYCIPVANILNGVAMDRYQLRSDTIVQFIAPTASVLVVDDIVTNLKVVEGLLSPIQMQVDTCTSGQEAIALVSRNIYDIVFMDHMMPEMDGVEATQLIRALPGDYFQHLPIIALTANAVAGTRDMLLAAGMDDFLAKPIDISKLNLLLETWLPREKRQPSHCRIERTPPKPSEPAPQAPQPVKRQDEPETTFDVAAGLELLGGDEDIYRDVLQTYMEYTPSLLTQLRETLGDLPAYTIIVHGIKGSSYSICANGIGMWAEHLEMAAKSGDGQTIRNETPAFCQNVTKLVEHIALYLHNAAQLTPPNEN